MNCSTVVTLLWSKTEVVCWYLLSFPTDHMLSVCFCLSSSQSSIQITFDDSIQLPMSASIEHVTCTDQSAHSMVRQQSLFLWQGWCRIMLRSHVNSDAKQVMTAAVGSRTQLNIKGCYADWAWLSFILSTRYYNVMERRCVFLLGSSKELNTTAHAVRKK